MTPRELKASFTVSCNKGADSPYSASACAYSAYTDLASEDVGVVSKDPLHLPSGRLPGGTRL